nr:hypothetical protein [Tanacetum cinerariifolium]
VKDLQESNNSPPTRHINRGPSPKASNSPPRVTAVKAPMVNAAKGNPQHALKDKGVIDSGCSRHMTGNMSYLFDFEEFNGGYVAFGRNLKGELEDITYSDEEDDASTKADFNNLETSITVSPIPTTRVHKDHHVVISGMESLKRMLHVTNILSAGSLTSQQMVLNSPCLTHIKNWLVQIKWSLFWTSVAVKKVNDVTRLQALVDKKKVVITKASIRDALHLDEAEGFSGVKTPLFEGMIVEQQVTEGDASAANNEVPTSVEEPSIPSPTPPTPPPQPSQDVPSTSQDKIAQALEITKLKSRVKKLERKNKASKLKRLKKVGSAQRINTSDDTVMDDVSKQGGIIANIDADENVVLKDAKKVATDAKDGPDADIDESAEIQRRTAESQAQIYQIDLEHANNVLSMQDEEESEPAKLQEVVDVITTTKIITEVVTTTSTTITAADVPIPAAAFTLTTAPSRRRKEVVIRDPQDTATTTSTIIHSEAKSKDKVKGILVEDPKPLRKQAQIKQKEKYARELKAELNINIDWDEVIDHVITISAAEVPVLAATTAAVPKLTAAPSRRTKGVVIRDPKKTTTTSTIIHTEAKSKDKGKWILVEEPKPLKKHAQIKQDEQYAMELERTSWNEFSSSMAFVVICLSSGKGFSGVKTPLFEGMIVEQQVAEGDDEVHNKGVTATGIVAEGDASAANNEVPTSVEEPSIPSPTPPTPPPQPSQDVPSTSQDKIAQALEITKLKSRVKKLERKNKASKLKRLKKVGSAQRINTSDDTVMDDVSKQGGIIANIDADENVVLKDAKKVATDAKDGPDADIDESAEIQRRTAESQAQIYQIDLEHANNVLSMQDEEESEPAKLQEVVDVITTTKIITEVVTTTSTTITAADVPIPAAAFTLTTAPSRRRKEVVIRDPQDTATTTSTIIHSEAKSKDKVKGILRKQKEDKAVKRYQALKRKPQTEAQARKNMMLYLKNVAGFKMDYCKGMTYDDIRPIFEKHFDSNVAFLQKTKEQMDEEDSRALKRLIESKEEKEAKKQKLDEEVEELKRHLQIVPNIEYKILIGD